MIDNISDIRDVTRLYQLYIMTDKILMMQSKSASGINYEILKKFKNISIRIDYLNMQNISLEMKKLDYTTKNFYEEQEKLTKVVRIMRDTIDSRKMLISKYRKYSVLPLVLENSIELDNFDYYCQKLDNINEYIKNEMYLSKLDGTLNSLGIELGNLNGEEDKLLSLIPSYEMKLKSFVLDNYNLKQSLKKYDFDIDLLLEDDNLEIKYQQIKSIYDEISDRYDTMKLVDNKNYSDIVRDITNEFNNAKLNENIIEIIKLIFDIKSSYVSFMEKRIFLKTYLLDMNNVVFGKDFSDLIDFQFDELHNVDTIKNRIDEIKNQIHKNNTLVLRLNDEQSRLKNKILNSEMVFCNEIMDNQVVNITDSYILYSKEKVYNVLKFVLKQMNNVNEIVEIKSEGDKDIFEDVSNDMFIDVKSNDIDVEKKNDDVFVKEPDIDNLFVDSENTSAATNDFNQNISKIESYDDIFTDNNIDLDNGHGVLELENSIFDNKINSEILDTNNFWPMVD